MGHCYAAQRTLGGIVRQAYSPVDQEQGERVPTFEDVVNGLGQVVGLGEFGALLAHVDLELCDQRLAQVLANRLTLIGTFAIDGSLDVEQRVDAAHDLDRDGREHDRLFTGSLPSGILLKIGHRKKWTSGMNPASRLHDWSWTSAGQVEFSISIKGIGLEEPGISGQMGLRMLALAVARIIEHCRRR